MQRWRQAVGVVLVAGALAGLGCGGGSSAEAGYGGYRGGGAEAATEGGDSAGYAAPAAVDRSAHVISVPPATTVVPGTATTVVIQGVPRQGVVVESVQPPPRAGLLTAASVG